MRVLVFAGLLLCEAAFCMDGSFMPPNDLHLQDKIDGFANISQDEFNKALDQVEAVYKPLLKEKFKAKLEIQRKWQDSTVNAYTTRYGTIWQVVMFGGLARRPEVTVDGFTLVACHELGHQVGGFPFTSPQSWAAVDGQSDYFATLSCGRELWKDEHDKNAEHAKTVSSFVKEKCDNSWGPVELRNLCYRLAAAGKSLGDLLSNSTAKFEKPDRKVVDKTLTVHPAGQCRLDSYFQGALCSEAEWDKNIIPKTERASAQYLCIDSRRQVGARPKCWFKPTL